MFPTFVQGRWPQPRSTASRCQLCRSPTPQPVCEACVARFAQPRHRCRRCALELPSPQAVCGACLKHPPTLDTCVAAVDYAYPWSGLIGRFKFQAQPGWAAFLAQLMRQAPWAEPALQEADVLVPMPLSNARLMQRGYNQALELARQLAPGKTQARWLLRLRDTDPQATLDRAQRLRNVQGAYLAEPARSPQLQGRAVVLVDDVMTTGASLEAAALALRQAGAARITGLVLARTPAPR